MVLEAYPNSTSPVSSQLLTLAPCTVTSAKRQERDHRTTEPIRRKENHTNSHSLCKSQSCQSKRPLQSH